MSDIQVPTEPTQGVIERTIEAKMTYLFGSNWKTTVQGILSFVAVGGGSAVAWLTGVVAAHPGEKWAWVLTVAATLVSVASGAAKMYVGFKQKG